MNIIGPIRETEKVKDVGRDLKQDKGQLPPQVGCQNISYKEVTFGWQPEGGKKGSIDTQFVLL